MYMYVHVHVSCPPPPSLYNCFLLHSSSVGVTKSSNTGNTGYTDAMSGGGVASGCHHSPTRRPMVCSTCMYMYIVHVHRT